MSISAVALIIICIFDLSLGCTILVRNYRAPANRSFLAMCTAIVLWSVSSYLTNATYASLLPNELFNRIAFASGYLLVLLGLVFTYYFPARIRASRREFVIAGVVSAIVLLLSFTSLVAGRVSIQNGALHFSTGAFLGIYIAAFVLCVGLIAKNLRHSTMRAAREVRLQAKLVLFALSVTALLGITLNLLIPVFVSDWKLTQYGPFVTIVLITTISYAMIKHGLFDIRLVVARSLGYLFSLVALAALYGFIVFGAARLIFGQHFSVLTQVLMSGATGIAAVTFAHLKQTFDKLTNSVFYRDAYDPQELFDELNRILVSTLDLEKLLQQVNELLATSLKAQFSLIGLKEIAGRPQRVIGTQRFDIKHDDITKIRKLTIGYHKSIVMPEDLEASGLNEVKKLLAHYNIAVLVRLTPNVGRNEEGLGYLALGAKKSGYSYTSQDYRVLDTIANELIIAIQNMLHFEEIQNFNRTLQEKVIEATHEMHRTNEKLKALDETKDDFISMASHQLRTPLTSVKGYLSMVLDGDAGKLTPLERKMLTQAFISSQRMVYLISDLLNVSRLKTGRFIIETAPVNLADIISDEIAQLKETAATRDLTLQYVKPKNFPAIELDETKTRQVIMNFIDNAIYYTPAGGHIKIELEELPTRVELRVVDDGIGVPKSEQHHLFTKFYRAGNARKARPDGTGLGLFMARKVIIAQNGTLIVKSAENKGSTFGFSLPKNTAITEAPKTK